MRQPRFRQRLAAGPWLWCLVALLCLKAAMPMLAAVAADNRGVTLAEVCTVYGVRTVALSDAAAGNSAPHPMGDESPDHAAPEHCALGALATQAVPAALPAVLLHAPAQRLAAAHPHPPELPGDAALRWLSGQLHAPPPSA